MSASNLREQLLCATEYQKAGEIEIPGKVQNICLSGNGDVAVWCQGPRIFRWSATQPSADEFPLRSAPSRASAAPRKCSHCGGNGIIYVINTGQASNAPRGGKLPITCPVCKGTGYARPAASQASKDNGKSGNLALVDWVPQALALRRDGLTAIAIAGGQLHYINLETGQSGTASNENLMIDAYHKKRVKPVMNGSPSPWVSLSPSGRFAAWGPVCVKEYQEKPQFPLVVTDTMTRRSVVIDSVGGSINDGPLSFARISESGNPTAVADATGAISFVGRARLSSSTSGPVRAIGDSSHGHAWVLRGNGSVEQWGHYRNGEKISPKVTFDTGPDAIAGVRTSAGDDRILILRRNNGAAAAELWDFNTGKQLLKVDAPGVYDGAVSADGSVVVVAVTTGAKTAIQRWALEEWRIVGARECTVAIGDQKPIGRTTGNTDWQAENDSACAWFNTQYGLPRTNGDAAIERAANGTDADIRLSGRDKPLPSAVGGSTGSDEAGLTDAQGTRAGSSHKPMHWRLEFQCDSCKGTWSEVRSQKLSGGQGVVCPLCHKQGARVISAEETTSDLR